MTKERLLEKHLEADEVISNNSPNNVALCKKMAKVSIEYAISILEELEQSPSFETFNATGPIRGTIFNKIQELKKLL